ncbi:MAG TPA: ABC transporter permease [Candidatus Dormibacteraeota bacterium]|nr:ABC transporter permease [Candidatus Dormibacteraeota bacterium]
MFELTYIRHELTRRLARTILTVLGLAIGVGLVIAITALTTGLNQAQARVLDPLGSVGTDLLITRPVNLQQLGQGQSGGPSNQPSPTLQDVQALQNEAQSAAQAAITDLSKLGKPGDHFVHDFFLPATQLTFPAQEAQTVGQLPGVAAVSSGLTLVANHQEGTIPEIVAEFKTPGQTVEFSPPTAAEQAQIQACVQKLQPSTPPTPPPPGQRPSFNLPPGFINCLPDRFRRFVIQQQVYQQVLAPPKTDINTSTYTIAGVDPATPDIGLVTRAQVTKGRFLAPQSDAKEVVLAEAYAQQKNSSVGGTLAINGVSYTVVGLARPPLGGQPADVYLSLSNLQALSGRQDRANVLLVRAASASQVDRVEREIVDAFPGAQVTSSKDVAKAVSGSLVDAANLASRLGFVLALVVLGAAFLMAGLLTLASVGKRVRELGTLRAIGWRKARVVRQILGESLAQGLLGAAAGVALGLLAATIIVALAPPLKATAAPLPGPSSGLAAFGLGRAASGPTSIDVRLQAPVDLVLLLIAVGLALLGGMLAGTVGAMRAARLRPASALRDLG